MSFRNAFIAYSYFVTLNTGHARIFYHVSVPQVMLYYSSKQGVTVPRFD